VKPGKTALTSYDFERPSTSSRCSRLCSAGTYSDQELFDFRATTQKGDGQVLATTAWKAAAATNA
jgi:hypothetical protein